MAATSKKLSIIIPAYNKDAEVFSSISCMVDELKHTAYDWEIIVVDDASQDKTLREAIRSKVFNGNTHRIKIYSYDLNQGKGFAIYYGFKQSEGGIVMFADADLDLPAENIPILLDIFKKTKSDIVIGSKRHPKSKIHYPLSRKFLSKNYQLLTRTLFSLNLTDTQVGLKVFRREVLEATFPYLVVKNFAFDLELLVVANKLGFAKITEAPIKLDYKFTSTIKLNAIRQILQDTLAIYYRTNILKYYEIPHFRLKKDEVTITPKLKAFV